MVKLRIKIGDVFETNNYGDCRVLEYIDSYKVVVEFTNTGYVTVTGAGSLRKGGVKDPYVPSIQGVGYFGEGIYTSSIDCKKKPAYAVWKRMLERCYDITDDRYHRYGGRGVTVCEEWYNFQIYARWYEDNYIEGFHVDKDLRQPGSMVYSEATCEFIPHRINALLSSRNKARGKYPVGVSESRNKFKAKVGEGGGQNYIGTYSSPEQAFAAYKKVKEKYIKTVAKDCYNKGEISIEVYNTLMNWVVIPYPN
jgi:hypothetical protein